MKAIYRQECPDTSKFEFIVDDKALVPEIGDNEVKVKIKACGISHFNYKVVSEVFRKCPRSRLPGSQEVSGIVAEIGPDVTSLTVGSRVAGIIPLDSDSTGCAEFCILDEYNLVKLPDAVSFVDAAGSLGDAVKAYTALHYQSHTAFGNTILVLDGAMSWGSMVVQLAQHWGAKVLATACTDEEKSHLESLQNSSAQIVDLGSKSNLLSSTVMEETGGLGVDVVIDNGVRLFTNEDDIQAMGEVYSRPLPSKHDVISCLGVGSRWVTSQFDLQLDPPDCQQLFLRGATVGFLFDQIWTLASAKQGCYQHILQDAIDKLSTGVLKPNITKIVKGLDQVMSDLTSMTTETLGKTVVSME